jgi:hypothetical protein
MSSFPEVVQKEMVSFWTTLYRSKLKKEKTKELRLLDLERRRK